MNRLQFSKLLYVVLMVVLAASIASLSAQAEGERPPRDAKPAAPENVYLVTSNSDAAITTCTGAPGDCSLRGALLLANVSVGSDVITISPTITSITLNTTLSLLGNSISISGNGQEVTSLIANGNFPVFTISSNTNYINGFWINSAGNHAGTVQDGVLITGGSGNDIAYNTISDLGGTGVDITGGSGASIHHNVIGTVTISGVQFANCSYYSIDQWGIYLDKSADNQIFKNTIGCSGRDGIGISGSGATGNELDTNFIGIVDWGGQIPNKSSGVAVFGGAHDNLIGDPTQDRNIISANKQNGVYLAGAGTVNNLVQFNTIGLDPTGSLAAGNAQNGITLAAGAANNTIGGSTSNQRNTISGNYGYGVLLADSATSGNTLDNNYIGVNLTGTLALPNILAGVGLVNAGQNIIGTAGYAGKLQLISGNRAEGISIVGTNQTYVGDSNRIGVAADSSTPLGNGREGLMLYNSSRTFANPFVIRFNGLAGAAIIGTNSLNNTVLPGVITNNGGLPTDLGNDGPTLNHYGAGYAGPNMLLNYPRIHTASGSSVSGSACANCFVHIYQAVGNPAAIGGGGFYLTAISADGIGNWSTVLPSGLTSTQVSLVAADAAGNMSEMSPVGVLPASRAWLYVADVGPNGTDPAGNGLPGGRIQDVALDPATANAPVQRLLAIAERGGMWASLDSGASWYHIPGLEPFGQDTPFDIKFDPTDPTGQRVFVTTQADGQSATQSGVYRSLNGGVSWSAPVSRPAGCPTDYARRLAIDPNNGQNVYVAASCAVGISHDGGNSFQWVTPGTGNYYGMMVARDGTAYTCGAGGVFQRVSDIVWTSIGNPSEGQSGDCEIAPDPTSSNHLFISGHWSGLSGLTQIFEVYHTASWRFKNLNSYSENNGRPTHIETRLQADGKFSLYWGNSEHDQMQDCDPALGPTHCTPSALPPNTDPALPWRWLEGPHILHADTSRLVFNWVGPNQCLLLAAGDYGFMVPKASDCDGMASPSSDWHYTNTGLHALQVYNMAGTQRRGGTTDLYLNMQDNGWIYRSGAPGDWRSAGGSDAFVSIPDRVESATPVRMVYFDNLGIGKSKAHYDVGSAFQLPTAPWSFPLGAVPGSPKLDWFGNKHYVLVTENINDGQTQAFTTEDEGGTWKTLSSPLPGGYEDVRASGTTSPVFYVRSGGLLRRVSGLGLSAVTTPADVGLNNIGFYGVSVNDPNRLYAFDCAADCVGAGRVVSSRDGGASWLTDSVLTRLIQQNQYADVYPIDPRNDPLYAEAGAFAFDPADEDIIVAGTGHAGVLVSIDGGSSWGHLPVSVPIVRSIFFERNRGHFFFSTYSRGVWEVRLGATSIGIIPVNGATGLIVNWTAVLRDTNLGALAGRTVIFELVNATGAPVQSASAVTSESGYAIAPVQLIASVGNYTLRARYAGETELAGSETEAPFQVLSGLIYVPMVSGNHWPH